MNNDVKEMNNDEKDLEWKINTIIAVLADMAAVTVQQAFNDKVVMENCDEEVARLAAFAITEGVVAETYYEG